MCAAVGRKVARSERGLRREARVDAVAVLELGRGEEEG